MKDFKFRFNFHLFDGVLNTQTTLLNDKDGKNDLSPEMKTFYDRVLLRSAEPELVHDQFAQQRPIPAGSGKTIEFRKFTSLPKALTPLTEGVTPDGQKLNVTKITAEVKQYGGYVTTSDMLNLTAFDQVQAETLNILGTQAGQTSDTITRDVLASAENVLFPEGVADRGDLTLNEGHWASIALIKEAVRILKKNNAPKIGDSYVAIVHPDTSFDLMNDPEWIEAQKYTNAEKIYKGEIGMMYGVRFVESTEAKIWSAKDASTTNPTVTATVPVYSTIVLGAQAYGVTKIGGKGIETIVKQLGSGGSADPLNQRATMGWKLIKTAEVLDKTRLVRIEHTASGAKADDASN